MTLAQTSIFDFKPRSRPAQRMGSVKLGPRFMYRTDAESLCESLGSVPARGLYLRCLEIDHSASYNAWCQWATAKIWWQNGAGVEVLVDHSGRVEAWVDPYPFERYYERGVKVCECEHFRVLSATVEGSDLRLELDGAGEWLVEVHEDSECRRCDRHGYRPGYDLEHFAIECYRHGLPEGMFGWRRHYVYGTPALRPFFHAMTAEEAKRIDLMGPIPGSVLPNEEFAQVCECAEALGVALQVEARVPALENLAMYPAERKCSSCLRKGTSNKDSCWKDGQPMCGSYLWDRRTPATSYRKSKKKAKCLCEEDEDEEGCE